MRRAANVDQNQGQIVGVLRSVGAVVIPCHQIGRGFPDLLVAFGARLYLLEVKVERGVRVRRVRVKDTQIKFRNLLASAGVDVAIVTTPEAALRAIGVDPVIVMGIPA